MLYYMSGGLVGQFSYSKKRFRILSPFTPCLLGFDIPVMDSVALPYSSLLPSSLAYLALIYSFGLVGQNTSAGNIRSVGTSFLQTLGEAEKLVPLREDLSASGFRKKYFAQTLSYFKAKKAAILPL